jgi:hypothetical protein
MTYDELRKWAKGRFNRNSLFYDDHMHHSPMRWSDGSKITWDPAQTSDGAPYSWAKLVLPTETRPGVYPPRIDHLERWTNKKAPPDPEGPSGELSGNPG